jgi:hypothetical protein
MTTDAPQPRAYAFGESEAITDEILQAAADYLAEGLRLGLDTEEIAADLLERWRDILEDCTVEPDPEGVISAVLIPR